MCAARAVLDPREMSRTLVLLPILALAVVVVGCSGSDDAADDRVGDDGGAGGAASSGGEGAGDDSSDGGGDDDGGGGGGDGGPDVPASKTHFVWAKDGTSAGLAAALAAAPKTGRCVVAIPPGAWGWGNGQAVRSARADLVVLGAGPTRTRIYRTTEEKAFMLTFSGASAVRVGEIAVQGNASAASTAAQSGVRFSNVHGFRVDHASFKDQGSAGVRSDGTSDGVVDHCRFEDMHKPAIGDTLGYGVVVVGPGKIAGVPFGSDKATFVEDSVFVRNRHAVASNDGARYVFRHNTVTANVVAHAVDAHGQEYGSTVGTEWADIHDNAISAPATYSVNAVRIRGGKGLVWNNTVSGYAHAVSLIEQTPQPTGPVYIYGNKVGKVDLLDAAAGTSYQLSAPAGYKPYAYPHPLVTTLAADAGADVSVVASGPAGATVTLDGTRSKGAVKYHRWMTASGVALGAAKGTVTFPVGVHLVVLEVEDAKGAVAHDTVVVDVRAK